MFVEQLAATLNPREGPDMSSVLGGITAVEDEALVLRLLAELNGIPEVTRLASC